MRTRNRPLAILLLCGVWLLGSASPPARADDGAATAILSAMRQAAGGGWADIRSLHLGMTVANGGQQARAERWEDVTTGRFVMRETWPTYLYQRGFDGITAWRQDHSGIPYGLGDADSALVAADEAFRVSRSWWFRDRHPATIAVHGTRSDAGRRFDVLDVTPEGGRLFQAWIDRSTHLLDRTIEQQAEDHVVTRYSDYRPVHGVMVPFLIRSGDGIDHSLDETRTVQTVEINPDAPDRLYAIPERPAPDITLPPHRDSVEVPFRLTADNRILVPLTVDGRRTVEAEFDSGGGLIFQPSAVARMRLGTEGRSKQTGGGEGATTAANGRIGTVALGDASVRNLAFRSFAFDPDEPDEALVGLEILQRFVVGFDFDRQVMTLTRPDAFTYHGRGAIIPFRFQDNQPEIRGSIDGIAGLLTIDTGDGGSLLLIAPFARRYGLVGRYQADLPYGGVAIGATHGVWARRRAGTISFDGADGRALAQVHDPVTRISLQHSGFDADREVSASIGIGILRQFNLTFDYTRQQIILEPNRLYGRKDVFNRAGLRLMPAALSGDRYQSHVLHVAAPPTPRAYRSARRAAGMRREGAAWSVTAVYPGSPAADAGLLPGDAVSRIDGRSTGELDRDGLWSRLEGPVGTSLELDVRSRGVDRRVTLSLRDIL